MVMNNNWKDNIVNKFLFSVSIIWAWSHISTMWYWQIFSLKMKSPIYLPQTYKEYRYCKVKGGTTLVSAIWRSTPIKTASELYRRGKIFAYAVGFVRLLYSKFKYISYNSHGAFFDPSSLIGNSFWPWTAKLTAAERDEVCTTSSSFQSGTVCSTWIPHEGCTLLSHSQEWKSKLAKPCSRHIMETLIS